MGKKILVQRRGRGSSVFQAQRAQKIAPAKFIKLSKAKNESSTITLVEITHERGRTAPLAKFEFEGTRTPMYLPAVEGITVGETFSYAKGSEIRVGNILTLQNMPESVPISCIEHFKETTMRLIYMFRIKTNIMLK